MTRSGDDGGPTFRRLGLAVVALTFAACSSGVSASPGGQSGGSGAGGNAGSMVNVSGGAGVTGLPAAGGTSQGPGGSTNAAGASSSGGAGASGGSTSQGGVSGGSSSSGGASSGSSGGSSGNGGVPSGGSGGSGGMPSGSSGGTSTGGYWKPTAGTSWQWQLTGKLDTTVNVAVYDIDGFDNTASGVKALHDQGRKVICYLSVGSYEDWRPDAAMFPASVLGNDYPGWPGERFVDIRAKALRDIMATRFDMCKQKGFDGIEPDNMDVYGNNSGFPLKEQDGVDYANWMASEIHARGLNIGQKNASEIAATLQPTFDWMLTEDCYDQGWCADVQVYVDHDKPVFMSEYTDTGVNFTAACAWAKPKKYSPILKGRDLDAPVQFCP